MTDNRYAAAGWAAILSAVGSLAMLGLSFAFDFAKLAPGRGPRMPVPWSSDQLALVVAVDAISWILGIYALVRFRDLLRERYGFHGVDRLIWVVVAAGLLAGIASHAQRYTMSQGAFSLPLMLVVGIVLGVAVFVGMHTANQSVLFAFYKTIDRIAGTGQTTILFVSHHIEETPDCITHYLILVREGNQPSRAIVSDAPAQHRTAFNNHSTGFYHGITTRK